MQEPQNDAAQAPVPPKRATACDFCRTKKIRCVGDDPCSNCIEHRVECVFSPRQRRQKRSREGLPSLARRLARFKDLLEAARTSTDDYKQLSDILGAKTRDHPLHSTLGIDQPQQSAPEMSQQQLQSTLDVGERHIVSGEAVESYQHYVEPPPRSQLPRPVIETPSHISTNEAPWERLESPNLSTSMDDREDVGGYHTFQDDIVYWGRSSMAICSQAGIAWVKDRVKQPDFKPTANRFTQDVARRLKMEKKPAKARKEEPGLEDALKFTQAYFEEATEAALGIVRRSCFETRLRSSYLSSTSDDDPSWYALRNVIFASGCRLMRSRDKGYTEAHQESWSYFENALSVHAELLYFRTSVVGVQALTLMAYFSEAVSCRMLQYMLVANAYRLACGQGLHVQPVPSWNLSEEEKSLRQCVFWAIYCLDKQIACRSGRPGLIDDEEINCQLPTSGRSDDSVNVRYTQACIEINHLASRIRKMLFTASAWRQAPENLVNNVTMLQMKLDALRANLKAQCQIDLPLKITKPPAGLDMQQALSIQFLYYNLVWDIHTTLAHPWFRGTGLDRHPDFQLQIAQSCSIVAETSRAAILDCRFIQLDASCPMP
ncbi:fungal-specific transcription factor domain-containing protein [Exophiala viscosa]|nr:fungal-specific transcription factor domain-containing protein [Exophiala viscosa]